MIRRLRFAAAAGALAALVALPAAHPAPAQLCRGIVTLETITILADTDPDELWPTDKWSYHIFVKQNEKLAKIRVRTFVGNTGKVVRPDLVVANKIVGEIGDPVSLWIEQWSAEKDPADGREGIPPADRRSERNGNPFQWERETPRTCEPGDERFTTIVDVPASPGDDPAEHDGLLQYDWLWTFEAA